MNCVIAAFLLIIAMLLITSTSQRSMNDYPCTSCGSKRNKYMGVCDVCAEQHKDEPDYGMF